MDLYTINKGVLKQLTPARYSILWAIFFYLGFIMRGWLTS